MGRAAVRGRSLAAERVCLFKSLWQAVRGVRGRSLAAERVCLFKSLWQAVMLVLAARKA